MNSSLVTADMTTHLKICRRGSARRHPGDVDRSRRTYDFLA